MKKVVVIGGAVLDILAYPKQKMVLYDSNPGYLKKSLGGVGRNISENLARLGVETTLLTVIGDDEAGKMILDSAKKLNLNVMYAPVDQTPTYLSIMDENQEDLVSVIQMDDMKYLDKDFLIRHQDIMNQAELIVLDTNLDEAVIEFVCKNHLKPIYADAISGQKAIKLKPFLKHIHTLKLNQIEAEVLSEIHYETMDDLTQMGNYFVSKGVKEVFITLGKIGAFYANEKEGIFRNAIPVDVENGNGAGDAFFSGVIYANLYHKNALSYGMANAFINLRSQKSVSEELTDQVLSYVVKELNL